MTVIDWRVALGSALTDLLIRVWLKVIEAAWPRLLLKGCPWIPPFRAKQVAESGIQVYTQFQTRQVKRKLLAVVILAVVLSGLLPAGAVAAWSPWASEKESWVLRDMKVLTYSYAPYYQARTTSGWVEENGITRWVATISRATDDGKTDFGSYAVRDSEIIKIQGQRSRPGTGQLTGEVLWEDILHYAFQPPPDMLVPGEQVQLRLEGTLSGKPYEGVRYWGDEHRFMMRVEKWTLEDQLEWTVSFETLDLSYESRSASSELQFRVPETSEGRLVIYGYTDVAHIKDVMWVYEPGFAEDVDRPRILDPGEGLDDAPGIISVVESGVEIRARDGSGWKPAMNGTALTEGDRIRSGSGGKAYITFRDPSGGVANLTVGPDTEIDFDEFRRPASDEWGVVSLIRGMIRWTVSSWQGNSIFDVRAGTTITGVRGCDVMINYLPESDSLEVFVNEGDVTIHDDRTGLQAGLIAGQWIVVRDGEVDGSGTLDDDVWERFVANTDMDVDEAALVSVAAPTADQPSSSTAVVPGEASSSQLRSILLAGGLVAAVLALLIGLGLAAVVVLRSR